MTRKAADLESRLDAALTPKRPTRLAQAKTRAERAEARAQRAEMLLTWRIKGEAAMDLRVWSTNSPGGQCIGWAHMRLWHPERADGGVVEVISGSSVSSMDHVEVWGWQDLWDALRDGTYNAPWRHTLAAMLGISVNV